MIVTNECYVDDGYWSSLLVPKNHVYNATFTVMNKYA